MQYLSAGEPGTLLQSNPGRSLMIRRTDGAVAPSGLFDDPMAYSMGTMLVRDGGSSLGDYGLGQEVNQPECANTKWFIWDNNFYTRKENERWSRRIAGAIWCALQTDLGWPSDKASAAAWVEDGLGKDRTNTFYEIYADALSEGRGVLGLGDSIVDLEPYAKRAKNLGLPSAYKALMWWKNQMPANPKIGASNVSSVINQVSSAIQAAQPIVNTASNYIPIQTQTAPTSQTTPTSSGQYISTGTQTNGKSEKVSFISEDMGKALPWIGGGIAVMFGLALLAKPK